MIGNPDWHILKAEHLLRAFSMVVEAPNREAAAFPSAMMSFDGMLYVNSGYAQWGGLPGNVLLAFEVSNP